MRSIARLGGRRTGDYNRTKRPTADLIPRFPGFRVISLESVGATDYCRMSEVTEPGLELAERQNRFVSDNLRRIFVQIYRIVRNVADAEDLTQEAFIKALQHQ